MCDWSIVIKKNGISVHILIYVYINRPIYNHMFSYVRYFGHQCQSRLNTKWILWLILKAMNQKLNLPFATKSVQQGTYCKNIFIFFICKLPLLFVSYQKPCDSKHVQFPFKGKELKVHANMGFITFSFNFKRITLGSKPILTFSHYFSKRWLVCFKPGRVQKLYPLFWTSFWTPFWTPFLDPFSSPTFWTSQNIK
jgi:hypothetical protein